MTYRYSTAVILLGVWSLACNGDGGKLTEPTIDPAFLLAPKSPSNTRAVAVAYDAVRVSWTDNSTNENGFQVYRSTTGATGTYSLRATRSANADSFRDTQVAPRTSYCYKVRAFRTQDGTTSYSAFSNAACATTPASPLPLAPSGMVARPVSSSAVRTTWTDKSSNEDGFRIQRSVDGGAAWTTAATVGPNISAFRDNGRSTEQPVCYRVVSFNEHGSSAPSNVDCTAPPAAPTNLTASATAEGGIHLTWSDNSNVEDGYQVQRSIDGTTFSSLTNLPANTTSYSDAGATENTTYWYRVRARKEGGFSEFSNVTSAAVPAVPPAAPSGTSVRPYSSTQVWVTWTDNSTTEVGFRVERSSDGGVTWAPVTSPTSSGIIDGGRSSDQEVCYRVIAFNTAGDSPPSNTDCTTPPAAPSELRATVIDEQTLEISWRDNSSVEDSYELWLYGCYYYEYYGCYEYYYYAVPLPANTTSYRTTANESPYVIAALKDGGYSDWVYPDGGGTSASLQSGVVKGGRPPASAQRTPPVLEGRQRR